MNVNLAFSSTNTGSHGSTETEHRNSAPSTTCPPTSHIHSLDDSYSCNLMMEDTSLRLPDLEGSYRMNLRCSPSCSTGRREEESWSGLYMTTTSDTIKSNKKLGHASFTDLGLYTKSLNQSAQEDLQQRISEAKHQFMKLRFQRLHQKTQPATPILEEEEVEVEETRQTIVQERLLQSDSALCFLRRESERDTIEFGGIWYRAKHPKSKSLERLIHSAPELYTGRTLGELPEEDDDNEHDE